MTNLEIENRLTVLVKNERALTEEILTLIREAHRRRLYLERGFANIYEWLVRGYGYSHSSAYRRIQAAQLLESVPEAKEKLASGELNLTILAQLQSAITQEEKRAGTKVTKETKQGLTAQIEGKSAQETDQIIRIEFPELKKEKELLRAVDKGNSRLTLILEKEAVEALKRVKELLSHSHPGASYGELIKQLALDFVKRKDPLAKAPKQAGEDKRCSKKSKPGKTIPAAVRRAVFQRAKGKCEYKDPLTGRICASRVHVEIDHRQARALGGGNELANLRCLCKSHNFHSAEHVFGTQLMSAYRATAG